MTLPLAANEKFASAPVNVIKLNRYDLRCTLAKASHE
jgi:hypothetical protein